MFLRIFALALAIECCMMLAVYVSGKRCRPLTRTDVIIVLGARVMPDGTLSTTLQNRADKALDIYRQGYAPLLILCGGRGGDEPLAEADAMASYLLGQGIPEDKILTDTRSTDTIENLVNAKALMDERKLKSAIIVTSDYHVTRALWIANDAGIRPAIGAGAPGQTYRINRILDCFRESLSWINYWSGGQIKNRFRF